MTPKIEECLRRLKDSVRVAVDVETSGLSWQHNHVVGHVLTFGPYDDDSYYLPVRHGGGGNIEGCSVPDTTTGWKGDLHPLEKEIIPLLDRQKMHLIFHNGAFDLRFLYRLGFNKFDARLEDTMLNATLLNELQQSVSLDYCCKVMGVAPKKIDIYDHLEANFPEAKGKGAMGHFWRLAGDDPKAVAYAAGDGTSTFQLWAKQQVQLEADNLQLVHSVECRVMKVLARMMTRGVKIDVERLHQVRGMLQTDLESALAALPKDFNSRSSTQVRKLMEDGGFTDWPMTAPTKHFPNGQPSFSEAWLLTNPNGAKIVKARKISNLINSFIQPMIETHLWNGRVHPEYHQLRGDEYGTITGRLSSSNPNLQQVNKRNKELGRIHRSIFVPDEGMLWGAPDYSQIEPRLLAYYSRCKALIDGYNANPPVDAHQVAANLAGIDRETGKRVNQTLITGGGKGVLATKYGVKNVDEVWDKYFAALPEIRVLQKTAAKRMRDRGFVTSLLGRRARMDGKDYVALNRLLQCGNADLLKLKLCEVDEYLRSEGDDVNLLNNVHDAMDFQFRPERQHIYDEALKIMCRFGPSDVIQLDIPVTVEGSIGKDWAEATYN